MDEWDSDATSDETEPDVDDDDDDDDEEEDKADDDGLLLTD